MPPSTPTEPGLPNNEVLSEGYQESYHKTEYHVSKIHERDGYLLDNLTVANENNKR